MNKPVFPIAFDPVTIPLHSRRLIEASAGTGKTYSITSLYIRLLLGHGTSTNRFERALQVNEILVVTFTNAATAELRGRIRQRLVDAISVLTQPNPDTRDNFLARLHEELHQDPGGATRAVRILTAAALMMDDAAIYSIHGFCGRMLAEFAVESNMPFELSMDPDDKTRLDNAIRDTWLEMVYGQDVPLAHTTLARWPEPSAMSDGIAQLVSKNDISLVGSGGDLGWEKLRSTIGNFKRRWREQKSAIRQAIVDANLLAPYKNNLDQWLADMDGFTSGESLEPPACFGNFTSKGFTQKKFVGARSSTPEHPIFTECEQLSHLFVQVRAHLERLVIGRIRLRMREAAERSHTLTPDDLLTRLDEALSGSHGAELASRIRDKHPIAMVDEFQDTDPIQYRIFDTIYQAEQACGLFMIGDPKQAIYKFRGADIFTYINAKRAIDREHHYNLGTNFRSTPGLINAINTLFDQPDAFLRGQEIGYIPVDPPADERPVEVLTIDDREPAAMTFWHYLEPTGKLNYGAARSALAEITANEVQLLLSADARIGGQPLMAREIAILVRSRTDAMPVLDALKVRGIGSTFRQRANVFTSEAAQNLWLVMKAALEPGNDHLIRAAYACPLMNRSLEQLGELETDTDQYLTLLQQFQAYHALWQRRGILPMLQAWMIDQDVLHAVKLRPDSERLLTDLRQLGELLQLQSGTLSGMHELMQYMHREMHKDDERDVIEDNMLRLESDENLVQIITIHSAKGLQFDVVMIPMAASAREESTPIYHDIPEGKTDYVSFCDLSVAGASLYSDSSQAELNDNQRGVLEKIDRERLEEELRLFYVAVTRARKKCYIGLANLAQYKGNLKQANLGFAQSAPGHLLLDNGDATDDTIRAALSILAKNQQIEIREIAEPGSQELVPADGVALPVREPLPAPVITDHWALASYSALTRNLHTLQPHSGTGDDIDVEDGELEGTDRYSRFSFPRGAHTGVLLHSLFEQLEFTAEEMTIRTQVREHLTRSGYDAEQEKAWYGVCTDWVMDVLECELSADPDISIKLRKISNRDKLVEMEFYFPLQRPVSAAAINQLLRDYGYLLPGQPLLEFNDLQGMMKGFIDLIFVYQGKCYLADYKSNHLGNSINDYAPELLPGAIRTSRYDLQYLIYTVALSRYLKARIKDYNYQVHFGGAYYLYLRGMSRDAGHHGVYFDKPAVELVDALDSLFGSITSSAEAS